MWLTFHWRTLSLLGIGVCWVLRVYFGLGPVKRSEQTIVVPWLSSAMYSYTNACATSRLNLTVNTWLAVWCCSLSLLYAIMQDLYRDLTCRWWLNHLQQQFSNSTGFFTTRDGFPFSAAIKDKAHPPPLCLWLGSTISVTWGSLLPDQICYNPRHIAPPPKVQTQPLFVQLKFQKFLNLILYRDT